MEGNKGIANSFLFEGLEISAVESVKWALRVSFLLH